MDSTPSHHALPAGPGIMCGSRACDLVFALFFSVFVWISVFVETPICLGEKVSPDSGNYWVRESFYWGLKADMIWVKQPTWSRTAVCLHCFGFAPCYFTLALAFLFRWSWIRNLGIAVCAAKLYAGTLYMAANLLDPEFPPPQPRLFVFQSCSYMVIPLLALIRFWSKEPFPSLGSHKNHRE